MSRRGPRKCPPMDVDDVYARGHLHMRTQMYIIWDVHAWTFSRSTRGHRFPAGLGPDALCIRTQTSFNLITSKMTEAGRLEYFVGSLGCWSLDGLLLPNSAIFYPGPDPRTKMGCENPASFHPWASVNWGHGISERRRVGVLLVSCVIERTGDFLHGIPSALSISSKNGVVPAGNDAISPWEAMTKSRCGFADSLIRDQGVDVKLPVHRVWPPEWPDHQTRILRRAAGEKRPSGFHGQIILLWNFHPHKKGGGGAHQRWSRYGKIQGKSVLLYFTVWMVRYGNDEPAGG